MNFKITYLAYSGRVVTTEIEDVDNEEDAIEAAYNEEGNYSSDCICNVIDVDWC